MGSRLLARTSSSLLQLAPAWLHACELVRARTLTLTLTPTLSP